ncbi:MAG: ketopantoate reductase family protein [Acidimicrobiales bacterium]
MRFVVYGAGAIGGVIGGRLHEHGHDVVLIARGAHYEAIRDEGLRVESPDASVVLRIPVVGHPAEASLGPDDIVLLTMKSQDTAEAVQALATTAPAETPMVCVQNGVENERVVLRWFPNVYGVCVMCPTTHLVPGVVQASSSPITGILDVGRYPLGSDAIADRIAAALRASTFSSEAVTDIMRWKYAKLVMNLGNAVEAVCGPAARPGSIGQRAKEEGERCLRAAGIAFATEEEDKARRSDLLTLHRINGEARGGGSSWQSLQRGAGSIETDYLNGEIALLGRTYGVPTPVNDALRRHANHVARTHTPPGSMTEAEFWASIDADALMS